jgi:cell division protein FtsZ
MAPPVQQRAPEPEPQPEPVYAPPPAPAAPPALESDPYARSGAPTFGQALPVGHPVLRVVGVGGAGVNAVNRMVEAQVEGVEFLAINTDLQSLQQSEADVTLHIGQSLTRGLGSGSNPDLGRASAMEEYDKIKALLKGSDMVFITAGAGGGTGTGAAPVVARIAREIGALTVGIVTKPFGFEGNRRKEQADRGIEALADEVDTLIVVPNNRLLSVLDKNTSMVEAFRVADDVLRQGVQGISDLVTLPGLINLDFADVRTIMSEAGNALLGIGMGSGDKRAIEAAEQAVASPLLETSMEGARKILLSITGGRDLSLWEVNEAARPSPTPPTRTPTSSSARWSTTSSPTTCAGSRWWRPATATRPGAPRARADAVLRAGRRAARPAPPAAAVDALARSGPRARSSGVPSPEVVQSGAGEGGAAAAAPPAARSGLACAADEREGDRRRRPPGDRGGGRRGCCARAATPSTPRSRRCSPRGSPSRC